MRTTTTAMITALALLGTACGGLIGSTPVPAPKPTTTAVEVGPGGTGATPPPGGTGGGGQEPPEGGPGPVPVQQDPLLPGVLAGLTDWTVPTHTSDGGSDLTAAAWQVGRTRTSCVVEPPRTISRTFDQLAAFALEGPILPGLVVEGASVLEGDLRVVPLDRAPLRLVSNLDSANPVADVAQPTISGLQVAVTALKRDADQRLSGIDVTPADVTYVRQETHSFEESYLAMDASLRYSPPLGRARFDLAFAQQEQVEKHSIAVSMVQSMFTLRVDNDTLRTPADHFAATTTAEQVEQLVGAGRLSPELPPLLVETVTYGRTMRFTMTSSNVESASELEAAVSAAYGSIEGEASLTDRQRSLFREARIEMIAVGGDQDVALGALQAGDLDTFFQSVNTTTAAPLSMTLRTLDGDPVAVADEATVRSLGCTDTEVPHLFQVEVEALDGGIEVFINGTRFLTSENQSSPRLVTIPATSLRPGSNRLRVEFYDWFPCADSRLAMSVVRDGSRVASSRFDHGPLNGSWCNTVYEWDVDTNGTVTKLGHA